MAHLLFGADLSLALPGCGGHGDPDAGPVSEDTYAWPEAIGKEDHPAGLVDYLGTLPVSVTGVRAPVIPARSYGSGDSVNILESISTSLTLFYAGTINIFDNVTADKAQIVMSLAENSNSLHATTSSFKMPMTPSIQSSAPCGTQLQDPMKKMQLEMQDTTAHLSVGERFTVSEDRNAQELASLLVPYQAIVPKALPIARKASLARFLEKRKERVQLMAPYSAKGSARDVIIHQGAHHSNASTLQMFYNDFWGGPSAEKVRCAAYGNNVDVEDRNWFTVVENSKQASECGSAT